MENRPHNSETVSPETLDRRDVLSTFLKGATLGAVFYEAYHPTRQRRMHNETVEKQISPEEINIVLPELDENKLTERRVQTFMYAFARLTRKEVLLVDQNFNIIGGGPFELPAYILDLDTQIKEAKRNGFPGLADQIQEKLKEDFQTWLNRVRNMLKGRFPTIELDLDPQRKHAERPELISIRPNLEGRDNEETYFTHVWRNAMAPVSSAPVSSLSRTSRYEFVKSVFDQSSLPNGLKVLIPGIPAVESGYEDRVTSVAGAVGPWQIVKELGKERGLYSDPTYDFRGRGRRRRRMLLTPGFDHRYDFERATRAIVRYFETLYTSLKRRDDARQIMETFSLNEEDFIYPCVINSYQAGPTRISRMIAWFSQNYSKEKVREKLGNPPYGRDIYSLMSKEYVEEGLDPRYFRRSRDYFPQVMAMADLLEQAITEGRDPMPELPGSYEPPLSHTVEVFPVAKEERKKASGQSRLFSFVAPLVAGTAVFASIDAVRQKLSRRRFGFSVGSNILAGFGGMILGALQTREMPREMKEPSMKRAPARIPEEKEAKPPEIIHAPTVLAEQLRREQTKLQGVSLLSDRERKILRSRFSNPDLRRFAEMTGLQSVKDLEQLDVLSPRLTTLLERGLHYRLRHVGIPNPLDTDPRNDMRYARVLPSVERLLTAISDEMNQEAYKAGLPRKYRVRLVVTGAARTEEYQKKLADFNKNAAKWSSHTLLNSFDITWKRFDIIDTETNQFIMILRDSDLDKELRFATCLEAILGRIIIRLMNEGKIMARQESVNQSAFHIMSLETSVL